MALYEHIYIARQDISSTQVEALSDHLISIIEGKKGKVEKNDYWGLKPLAYKINNNRKGHYVLFELDAPYDAITEMERQMKINEDILRFMTIKVDALKSRAEKKEDDQ